MFTKLRFHYLRVGELLQFLYDVLAQCKQKTTEAMKLAASIAALQADTENFDQHFKLNPGSKITKELIALDDRRDDCVIGINEVLGGFSRHFVSATKTAAQDLLWNMDNYGPSIAQLNLPTETSTINSMLDEWSTDTTLAQAVITLNLTAWVNELKAINVLFSEKYNARADEDGDVPQTSTVEARKIAINTYRTLIKKIDASATLAEDQTYDTLINSINALIERYNILADSHKKEKDEEEPPK